MQAELLEPVLASTDDYRAEVAMAVDDLEYSETNRDVFVAISREYLELADSLSVSVDDAYSDPTDECDCNDSGTCGRAADYRP
jgi:hypothetical protein